jgi:hypothetical protein
LRVSSAAPRHRLDTIVSGRLWPIPLAPPVWEARSTGPERERTAWLEMEVSGGRPVETIRLIFGSAAGWSAHFNPARVDVLIRRAGRSAFDPPIAIQDPSGAYSTIRFAQPTDVEELRLEFSRESRMGPIEPARLTAAQMLGPGR